MRNLDVVAFDGDDTLWHTERLYVNVQNKLASLLATYRDAEAIKEQLDQTEARNIQPFGYGIKSFTLSMIEAAVNISEGHISGTEVQAIIDLGKGMLAAEVELLEHAAETVARLAAGYRLMLITKGDLQDQQGKINRSGLSEYFQNTEIVSEKSGETYARLLKEHSIVPSRFLMVGNSLRSDILPVLEVGGQAVHIPYSFTWQHESAEPPAEDTPGFHQIDHIGQLPDLIKQLEAA
jgi:putative hydrolase of the HAD superfamily